MAEIPFSRRWKLWLIAWGTALVVAGLPRPTLILYAWLFPWGLMEAVGWKRSGYDADYIVGWLPYIALTIAALCSRRRVLYFTFYVVLCILLILNVVGCQQMDLNFGDLH